MADDEGGPGKTWLDGPCVALNTLLKDKTVPEWCVILRLAYLPRVTLRRHRVRNLFDLTTTAIRCQNYEYEDLDDWVADDDVPFLAVGCAAHPFPVSYSLFNRV